MLIQIIFNLFLTFAPFSQVAPNCKEDVGKVEEGGRRRFFNEEFEHKRKKTSSTSCQWSESRHGESNFWLLGLNVSWPLASCAGWSCRRCPPAQLSAHLQRQRERPDAGVQLQPDEALAGGQGQVQSGRENKSWGGWSVLEWHRYKSFQLMISDSTAHKKALNRIFFYHSIISIIK